VYVIAERDDALALGVSPLRLVPGIPEWLSPLVTVIPGQLAAFRLATLGGIDVDNPNGLSKITLTV
jgi:glucosamine--fructose-6-phosphate aminotransferase (isomerizing)